MNTNDNHLPKSSPPPEPTRATLELPDDKRLRELALDSMTLEETRAVLVAVSLFVSKGRSKTRCKVGVMLSALVSACEVELARDGRVEPAAHPGLGFEGIPWNGAAMRKLAIDHAVLQGYWVRARNRADDACLPVEWALAFVPARFWPALLTLIGWGPMEAGMRAEEAMMVLAQTPIKAATRKRAAGSTLAKGTLESRVDNLWGFMQALIDLRAKVEASKNPSLPVALLAAWTFKPERIDLEACGAKEARIDTSGPPIGDCANLIRNLHRDWQQASKARRYIKLRKLVLATLLTLYGPREDALRMLDVDDYLPEYAFRNGTHGPALRLFPGKTVSHDHPHIVPLPPEPAAWLEEWIRYTGREIGRANSPLFPSRQPKPGQPITRIGRLYTVIAGADGGPRGHGSSYALLPHGDNPYMGYNPHAFRHTAYQAAKRAGVKAKRQQPEEFAHIDPDDFARAVAGHELNQAVKDTYRDLNQQHLAQVAVDLAWAELWHGGKRQGLDPDAITSAQQTFTVLALTVYHLEGELQNLHHSQATLSKRTAQLNGDALAAALIESNQIASQLQITIRDLARQTDHLAKARERLDQALTTPVALPDDLTDEEHARLLAESLGHATPADTDHNGPLAENLSADDLASVYGCSPQTINKWVRQGFPRGSRPWNPDGWITEGPRTKRLPVAAIDQTALTNPQQLRLIAVRRNRALLDAA